MAYCTYTELAQLTGTALSQSILEAIIAQSDREIDGILAKNNLSGSATGLIKAASLEFSIAGVITRHRMDGTMPSSITLGGLTMSDNLDAQISQHRSNGQMYVQSFIDDTTSGNSIDRWVVITNG
jgi:hypothetical protein